MIVRRLFACLVAAFIALGGLVVPAQADTTQDPYSQPGVHLVNGRYWKTECSNYSASVIRCTTNIYGTKVFLQSGRWFKQNDWVFNNLTYLPSPRTMWAGNPLGSSGKWTAADGRQWESECDSPATGRGACRQYVQAGVASEVGGVVTQKELRVFNSLVKFETTNVPWVRAIPAAAPARSDVPVLSAAVGLTAKPAPVAATPKPTQSAAPKPTQTRYSPNGWDCPANAPIKGNASSMIYHVPRGAFYDRTNPEECFTTEAAARAAGYRASKR